MDHLPEQVGDVALYRYDEVERLVRALGVRHRREGSDRAGEASRRRRATVRPE
ncbi:MAG: hypothetical protein AB1730_14340 [Myxococcota bacterium]